MFARALISGTALLPGALLCAYRTNGDTSVLWFASHGARLSIGRGRSPTVGPLLPDVFARCAPRGAAGPTQAAVYLYLLCDDQVERLF
mmetsp:Transcript_36453/g.109825  ORF Transcript_36453/g.109825 Transcript_36453/m.109825 type:complete len:88 (+) Transcript_36453:1742-2005(+)